MNQTSLFGAMQMDSILSATFFLVAALLSPCFCQPLQFTTKENWKKLTNTTEDNSENKTTKRASAQLPGVLKVLPQANILLMKACQLY